MKFSWLSEFSDDLKDEWNGVLENSASHVPFLRYEYQKAWWQTRGGGEWQNPRQVTVLAHEDGHLVGIAPLFAAEWEGRPALLLGGSIEISDYLDLIAPSDRLDLFVDGLLTFLEAQPLDWQALDLYNLLDSSPTLGALQRAAAQRGWRFETQKLQHSPYIPLTGNWETYLAGIDKKQRHEIRRKMRRLTESETASRWYIVSDPAQVEVEIEAFITLMAYDEQKAAFLTPPMREHMRNAMRCAFAEGCLHLAVLEIDGGRAAAYLSFDYLNRLWVYNSGLNPVYRDYSPGWVLLGHLLQWANESGRSEFDFMRGDEEYKYRFGAVDRSVLRATLTRS